MTMMRSEAAEIIVHARVPALESSESTTTSRRKIEKSSVLMRS